LPIDAATRHFGENTFAAVADAYARLQANGQYGPYALVLQTIPYADAIGRAIAAQGVVVVTPADRIKALVSYFYGTGTLPGALSGSTTQAINGVLLSLGGNTMDLVVGMDATTAFHQVDDDGLYRFRVSERFALRTKDNTAIVAFEFATGAALQQSASAGRAIS
jgi:uncharacterized linocin/CFP29 family protein